MKRSNLNYFIDTLAALFFIGMATTGSLLYIVLPPGTNKSLLLLGHTRHQWGALHLWISLAFLAITFLHIFLHWSWVAAFLLRHFLGRSPSPRDIRISGIWFFIAIIGIFIGSTFLLKSLVSEMSAEANGESYQRDSIKSSSVSIDSVKNINYSDEILSIFQKRCSKCHRPNKEDKLHFEWNYWQEFLGKGSSKVSWIFPGSSINSPLVHLLSGKRKDVPHPKVHTLPSEELAKFMEWIDFEGNDKNELVTGVQNIK